MCRTLMEALLAAGYQLTDYEALVFLPAVVEKAGHNQVGGCEGARVWYLPFGLVGWGAAGGDDGAHTSPLGLGSLHHQPTSTVAPPPPPAPAPPRCLQDRVRALHRDVLRLASALHPPQRVIDYLVQGLASKSNRTKIECCGERCGMARAQCCRGGGFDMWGAAGAGGPELLQLLTACLVVAIGM
jgi:hypothetical protein